MTALERSLRLGAKAAARIALAIVGFVALLMVGWVPPELAAMLGSARGGGRERGHRGQGSFDGPREGPR